MRTYTDAVLIHDNFDENYVKRIIRKCFLYFRTLTSQNQVVFYVQLYVSKFLQTFEKGFDHALFEKLIFFISCFFICLSK